MHYNGFMKTVIDKLGLKIENSHVEHHKQVHLDQTMPPDNYNEEGLVFNFIDSAVWFSRDLNKLVLELFSRFQEPLLSHCITDTDGSSPFHLFMELGLNP